MGKLIKNDILLANLLGSFFERLAKKCDRWQPNELYLALAAEALAAENETFFACSEVTHYGHLKEACINTLPSIIEPQKILHRIESDLSQQRLSSGSEDDEFKLDDLIQPIINLHRWKVSEYGVFDTTDSSIVIGKRHPRRIAQEALRTAAALSSDKLYDKAICALKSYILIDNSIFWVYAGVADCYDELWGEPDIDAPCSLLELAKIFDPYAPKANPELDFRYREYQITPELLVAFANML